MSARFARYSTHLLVLTGRPSGPQLRHFGGHPFKQRRDVNLSFSPTVATRNRWQTRPFGRSHPVWGNWCHLLNPKEPTGELLWRCLETMEGLLHRAKRAPQKRGPMPLFPPIWCPKKCSPRPNYVFPLSVVAFLRLPGYFWLLGVYAAACVCDVQRIE